MDLETKLKIFDQISKLSENELDSIFSNIQQSSFSFEEWSDEIWHTIIQKLTDIGVSIGIKKQHHSCKQKALQSTKESQEIFLNQFSERSS